MGTRSHLVIDITGSKHRIMQILPYHSALKIRSDVIRWIGSMIILMTLFFLNDLLFNLLS